MPVPESGISWVIWLPIAGVICGSIMQFIFNLLGEHGKRREQLRTESYVAYLAAVSNSALCKSEESRQKILADAAYAKTRIVIYGTVDVIKALKNFEQAGSTASTLEGRKRLMDIVIGMRGDKKISRDDISCLLLGIQGAEDSILNGNGKGIITMNKVDLARAKWVGASDAASELGKVMHQLGSGYGDPEARMQDEHRLQTTRYDAERLFREYDDLSRQQTDMKILMLQASQKRAMWASFAVAAVVGVATIIGTVVVLFK
ncbi:hypothetical protein [Pseudomonas sp. MWU12-2345]|uniref:hypothetical protein n=1 Tax=Pseudomonas sp. MWU12-2345 TaxID=2928689 RepID=UPI0020105E18|nr:hypothetical protein [Pseudomonas sp. MWU12-2345]